MFIPNTVGHPYIHQQTQLASAAAWTPNSQGFNAVGIKGNVVNAAPSSDFQFVAVQSNAASGAMATNQAVAVLQQFTVTTPLAGDAAGIEVSASMFTSTDELHIIPIFTKLNVAGGALWAAVDSDSRHPVHLGPMVYPVSSGIIHCSYKTEVVHQETDLGATYAHGFLLINLSGGDVTINNLNFNGSVRQLNDQQNIGYRDTRR